MSARWLLLIHSLPPKPDYFRVKVRRRLERIGAEMLKNSVYALPASDEAREDFQWLRRQILDGGGEATLCTVEFLHAADEAALRERFGMPTPIAAGDDDDVHVPPDGATWVTRRGVHVDRIASAWLIKRFIDPRARFEFVDPGSYRHSAGELRFDMYDGEYTHEGESCTFETLLRRFGLRDEALTALGEIVHDIDFKDDHYGRPEVAGVRTFLAGLARTHDRDRDRIEAGRTLFDSLYQALAAGGDE